MINLGSLASLFIAHKSGKAKFGKFQKLRKKKKIRQIIVKEIIIIRIVVMLLPIYTIGISSIIIFVRKVIYSLAKRDNWNKIVERENKNVSTFSGLSMYYTFIRRTTFMRTRCTVHKIREFISRLLKLLESQIFLSENTFLRMLMKY